MSDCKECGCAKIADGRGFAVCVPCLTTRMNKAETRLADAQAVIERIWKLVDLYADVPEKHCTPEELLLRRVALLAGKDGGR